MKLPNCQAIFQKVHMKHRFQYQQLSTGFTWVFPKIGDFTPKMDGENHGKPY